MDKISTDKKSKNHSHLMRAARVTLIESSISIKTDNRITQKAEFVNITKNRSE